jgi:hypothetical protein
MRTATIKRGGLLPVLGAPGGAHEQRTRLPHVERGQINNFAGSVTVTLPRGRPRSRFHQIQCALTVNGRA